MAARRRVLIVGLDPAVVPMDGATQAHFPGLDPATVRATLEREAAALEELGHKADLCPTDDGATAEAVLARALDAAPYDCVVVGAGVRVPPTRLLLFERLLNVVHRHAPQSAVCFDTRPGDTAAAARRWV